MPWLIYDLRDGRSNDLLPILTNFLAQQEYVSLGMQLSVQCNEEISFSVPGEFGTAPNYPYLNDLFEASGLTGQFGFAVCDLWQSGQADPIENQPVSSDIPTLILAGEYDPITPPRWGREVADGFSGSFYNEFPGIGHAVSIAGECPLAVTLAFIADPQTAPPADCIAEMGPPDFAVPAAAAAETVPLESYSSDTFDLSGVIPVGWEELAPGTFVRGASGLDQTVLFQQAAPPGISVEAFLGLFTSQLGIEEIPAQSGEYVDENGRSWSLFALEFLGLPINIGVHEDDAGLLIVILMSESRETDSLYDAVFIPAIEAIMRN